MKGVSSTVILILATIGISIIAGIIVFWKWSDLQGRQATEVACIIKQRSYCNDVINGENPNWNELAPKTGCEKFGIAQPTSDQCTELVK